MHNKALWIVVDSLITLFIVKQPKKHHSKDESNSDYLPATIAKLEAYSKQNKRSLSEEDEVSQKWWNLDIPHLRLKKYQFWGFVRCLS
jgi:hypothetical protein